MLTSERDREIEAVKSREAVGELSQEEAGDQIRQLEEKTEEIVNGIRENQDNEIRKALKAQGLEVNE